MAAAERLHCYFNILRDLGAPITPHTVTLDLGCGSGPLVAQGRRLGCEFFGCDFILRDDDQAASPELLQQGILRQIDPDRYRLPFDDCSFDVVLSDQVFEHVMDYPTTLAEIRRVLRPDGVFLHLFPSRYSILEPHVYVPLGTMVRARWWLKLWALLGVRNRHQRQLSAAETCTANVTFLTSHTNYLPKRTLQRLFSECFSDVRFVEREFLKYSKRGRKVYELSTWLPFLPDLYGALKSRVIFGRRGASQLDVRQGKRAELFSA